MNASRSLTRALLAVSLVACIAPIAGPAFALSPDIVISQVYGGGGQTGSPYTNDFVELHNRSGTTVSLSGWSIQYASATGSGNFASNPVTPLTGSLAPGQYYLVQMASAGASGAPLPTPDAVGTVSMSATEGKVALVASTTGLSCNGGSTVCAPAQLALIKDLVGYGGANFYEGTAAAPSLNNTIAALRNGSGCSETDDNAADFTAGTPTPRNTTSPAASCCDLPYTAIYAIQGSGLSTPLAGFSVTTKGVVVGDYEGSSPTLRGFYLQDPDGDGNPATSDGIFVFNGNNDNVALGDVVYVSGTAEEFQDQTQIGSVTQILRCGTGSVTPVDVTLPVLSADDLERYEGMLVRLPQTLYVTETFQLGRFGQVVLSSGGRLPQPTSVATPGAAANAVAAANDLNRIILDDALNNQNPDPILFGRGGNPLSASNTLRGGDTVTGIVGVMTYNWAGNAASGNAYRVRPINALGASMPDFQPTNPRPAAPEPVGGSVRIASMNLLNFFNTFGPSACTQGVGGVTTACRGADDASEFARQWPKTVAAILAVNPDVLGVYELENDGYAPTSAIQFLVDKLNDATAPGRYAFIDVDANTGTINALGTDAVKVGLIYKPGSVTPVGQTAALNTVAFINAGDSGPRNRASLAQAFQGASGGVFVVDVNHLRSKGSPCDAPDAGDGQGPCNTVRVNAVNALLSWLGTDPTGTGTSDVLLVGDYNSYAKEDPISALQVGGFTNLLLTFLGPDAYSYVFDGEWGYLGQALASPTLAPKVSGVTTYHIDADEPSVLDYNDDFKSAGQIVSLYAPDQYRVSDHDPVIVGLTLNTPPDCSAAVASEPALWPPDHTYHGITIQGVTDADGDPVTITVTGVTQDEPVNSRGDGSTCPDALIADGQVTLRAERGGTPGHPGNGRVYAIAFTVDDGRGGECSGTVNVCVPHDEGKATCVDDGQRYDSTRPCTSGDALAPEVASLTVARLGASEAEISFGLPAETRVNVSVFDVVGRRVATLENGPLAAGTYSRVWNMGGVARGLYFVRMHAGATTLTQKVLKVH